MFELSAALAQGARAYPELNAMRERARDEVARINEAIAVRS